MTYYEELYHHGVKGMKWGVRRYQNPDGTLTSEGKKRLRSDMAEEYQGRGYSKGKAKRNARRDTRMYNTFSKYEEKSIKKRGKVETKLEKAKQGSFKSKRLGQKWINNRADELFYDKKQKNIMEDSEAAATFMKRYWTANLVGGGLYFAYKEQMDPNSYTNRNQAQYDAAKVQARREYEKKYGTN